MNVMDSSEAILGNKNSIQYNKEVSLYKYKRLEHKKEMEIIRCVGYKLIDDTTTYGELIRSNFSKEVLYEVIKMILIL